MKEEVPDWFARYKDATSKFIKLTKAEIFEAGRQEVALKIREIIQNPKRPNYRLYEIETYLDEVIGK